MIKIIRGLAFASMAFTISMNPLSARSQSEAPEFSIAINTTKPEVVLGSDIDIGITISNVSQQTLSFAFGRSGNVTSGYRYEVHDEKGAPVPKIDAERYVVTPEGERLRVPPRPPGDHVQGSLKPGQSIVEATTVSDVYKFDHPGKYTIQVSRKEPWSQMIYSNVITVTVLPAPSPPAP